MILKIREFFMFYFLKFYFEQMYLNIFKRSYILLLITFNFLLNETFIILQSKYNFVILFWHNIF